MWWFKSRVAVLSAIPFMCMSLAALSGCERKEKVIEIQTPTGEIDVERSTDSGKLDLDINVDKKTP